jgi:hypothetical protein
LHPRVIQPLVGVNVQVLEVATRELVVGGDLDLALTNLLDGNSVAEVVGAAVDLDAVLEELLEGGDVEDLVAGGLRSVDDVLQIESQFRIPMRLAFFERSFLTFLVC